MKKLGNWQNVNGCVLNVNSKTKKWQRVSFFIIEFLINLKSWNLNDQYFGYYAANSLTLELVWSPWKGIHLFWHNCLVSKLFAFPPHPLEKKAKNSFFFSWNCTLFYKGVLLTYIWMFCKRQDYMENLGDHIGPWHIQISIGS